uniref:Acidic fibroblast growth factor intracellular-binding protein n=1 Tax=Palpitomonas bilix TaxID=652834 RepID=A0A7S3DIK7_9EUKA|mmetsp:Transcript_39393/g.100968  ORF Transcript_39393/g.100968 Transcript_39393/m.100968 type:complete len:353 (+) Transcript_39393:298-1356(+)|eukprot:CAMPEP_0113882276 /NCGR_PEP_ID=MMETSP0780_2-20120614/8860_1 /TAXON_ID=652834 /ORGANISM="Palpitomonas bilix" /LENGTH=352 /DNA_ID=CAMNT_0000869263 /DNA_START=239 /DNA_END=1297 /DNA_ORIENTATION=+ /assembly_acc=CAM_ASM_000599
MDEYFDVSVTDPVEIDLHLFDRWVLGYTEEDSVVQKRQTFIQHSPAEVTMVSDELFSRQWVEREIKREVAQQYMLFRALKEVLAEPRKGLSSQSLFQLSSTLANTVIERFYALDELLLRELAGKKLATKLRRDLDDVEEKTMIPLVACKRQFDNVRRVLDKYKEEDSEVGDLASSIADTFMISKDLAKQYSSIVFLCYHRFECGRKRVAAFTFADLRHFAFTLTAHWTETGKGLQFDSKYLVRLQDLRSHVYNDKETLETCRKSSMRFLREAGGFSTKKLNSLNHNFVSLLRNAVNIASSLCIPNEMRDLFIDIVDKVGEGLTKLNLSEAEAELYFQSLLHLGDDVFSSHTK